VTRLLRQLPAHTPADVGDRLREAFVLVQEAMAEETPVVLCVDAPALLGQASLEDCAVATGLLGLARSVSFEGGRKGWSVSVLAVDSGAVPDPELVRLAETPALSGQVLDVSGVTRGKVIP
jgi:hypothetical protein